MLDINLTRMLIWLPAVLIGLTFHEYAHAKVADNLGDPTARYMGRMTLNPLVHIDPMGFILLIVAGFGWAKPVQVNPLNFRGDRLQGMMKVSIAGPLMNIFVAFTALLILNFALSGNQAYSNSILVEMMWGIVYINVFLAVFNLIPVPPLDGSKILAGLLGSNEILYKLERYGFIILIVLIFSGIIGKVLMPLSSIIINGLDTIASLIASPFVGLF